MNEGQTLLTAIIMMHGGSIIITRETINEASKFAGTVVAEKINARGLMVVSLRESLIEPPM